MEKVFFRFSFLVQSSKQSLLSVSSFEMDDIASLTATSTILKCALPAILYSGERERKDDSGRRKPVTRS